MAKGALGEQHFPACCCRSAARQRAGRLPGCGKGRDRKMENLKEQLIAWRHYLHQHPGTAFEETAAADLVAAEMRRMGIEVTEGVGRTGVVGTLKAGSGGAVIGIRADMDALPIAEKSCHDHVSQVPGKMHGCGHDGHTAMLLGAAEILSEQKDFNGTVRFIFQPAEEPGRGARAMIDDGFFARFPIAEIYGLHNAPFLPAGQLHTRVGGMAASEDDFTFTITGKGGHASSPHEGRDPLAAFAEIYLALQTIVSRNASPLHPVVVSCTEILTDGAHNAIPTHVEVRGDARTTSPADQGLVETRMRKIVEGVCAMNDMDCEFTYSHEFYPVVNSARCVETAVAAAVKTVGAGAVNGSCDPWMASEDFAAFLQHVPGCFLLLGSGKKAAGNISLHQNVYDFNDDILETGARFWAELVRTRLQ